MEVHLNQKRGLAVNQISLTGQIRHRINVLKSEQIGLKSFIQSDQILYQALEKAISELNWVLERLEEGEG